MPSVYQRSGSPFWYCTITATNGKRKGRPTEIRIDALDITDVNGKILTSKDQAREWAAETQRQIDDGEASTGPHTVLSWVQTHGANRKQGRGELGMLRKRDLFHCLGDIQLKRDPFALIPDP